MPAALLAVSLPPSATFLNQVAALSGWGVMATVLALGLPQCTDASGRLARPPIHWGLAALLGAAVMLGWGVADRAAGATSWIGLATIAVGAAALVWRAVNPPKGSKAVAAKPAA